MSPNATPLAPARLLDEIDRRQDELLCQLDELNDRLERLLSECSGGRDDRSAVETAAREAGSAVAG